MNQQLTVADTRADLELAKAFASAKMVPSQYQGSPGDCYIAIKLAQRFKMDPWTVMQEMYMVQNKPFMSGKLATAILNNSLAEPLRPTYAGEGDERTITLTGRPEGDAEPLSVTAKVKDAKTGNEQWKKNPDQMLMYFAARTWGRRYAPDILLGIVFDDEEIQGVTLPERPKVEFAAPKSQAKPDIIDELTGEVLEKPVALPKRDNEKFYDWGVRFVACVRSATDIDTVDAWLAANYEMLDACQKEAAKVFGNIRKAIDERKLELLGNENEGQGAT